MIVEVHVEEQFSSSPGKTQKCAASTFEVGKRGLSLTIFGKSSMDRGKKSYDTTAKIRFTKEDLEKIVSEAVALGLLQLNSAEEAKIQKARDHIEQAMKVLADNAAD